MRNYDKWGDFVVRHKRLQYSSRNFNLLKLSIDHDSDSWTEGVCFLHVVGGQNGSPIFVLETIGNGIPGTKPIGQRSEH